MAYTAAKQTEYILFVIFEKNLWNQINMGKLLKVVALVSGVKDSCYSMLQCVSAGQQIVALANLNKTEGYYNW